MSIESSMKVAAVYRDGSVRIYGPAPKDPNHGRPYVGTKKFAHYGAALEWADEFEETERKAAAKRAH